MKALKKALSGFGDKARDIDVDDILSPLGLRRKTSTVNIVLPTLSFFLLGGAIGATIALFMAPSSGRRMRENVEQRIAKLRDRFQKGVESNDMPNSISAQ